MAELRDTVIQGDLVIIGTLKADATQLNLTTIAASSTITAGGAITGAGTINVGTTTNGIINGGSNASGTLTINATSSGTKTNSVISLSSGRTNAGIQFAGYTTAGFLKNDTNGNITSSNTIAGTEITSIKASQVTGANVADGTFPSSNYTLNGTIGINTSGSGATNIGIGSSSGTIAIGNGSSAPQTINIGSVSYNKTITIATNSTLSISGMGAGSNILVGGTITAATFNSTSKRILKENINDFEKSATNIINSTKIVDFNFIADEEKKYRVGFIADDTDSILSGKNKDVFDIYNCIGVLLKAVQELSKENKEIKEQLSALKKMA